ncbi:MAG: M35 family metallopeptidase [Bacteriovoracaceae bacterium]|nr:M35 family metallopeptidase [Bacteriovoracaceae bacterium]
MKTLIVLMAFFSLKSFASISGCNPSQNQLVMQAEKNVILRLSDLEREWPLMSLTQVKKDFVEMNDRVWVNGNQRHTDYSQYHQSMSAVFNKIGTSLSRQEISYQCESTSQKKCQEGAVIAYVLILFGRSFKTVHLCPSYFQSDLEAQSRTLMHEVSHAVANTEDLALDWWNGDKTDMSKAPLDAYHVEAFYNEPSAMILKRTFWNWIWPRKKP